LAHSESAKHTRKATATSTSPNSRSWLRFASMLLELRAGGELVGGGALGGDALCAGSARLGLRVGLGLGDDGSKRALHTRAAGSP
jgi:hypothetical protein